MSKDNLDIIRTEEEAREKGRKGGIASGKARREKKLMSQIYADFLMKEHDIVGKDGSMKKLSGQSLLNSVMSKVLARGDGSSVRLMKEIREATEGQNIRLDATVDYNIDEIREELYRKLKEIVNKTNIGK